MTRWLGGALVVVGIAVGLSGVVPGRGVPPPAVAGDTLFVAKGCAACHTLAGVSEGGIGPDLTNLAASPAEVRRSIVDPAAELAPGFDWAMPQLRLSEADVDALVEFLATTR